MFWTIVLLQILLRTIKEFIIQKEEIIEDLQTQKEEFIKDIKSCMKVDVPIGSIEFFITYFLLLITYNMYNSEIASSLAKIDNNGILFGLCIVAVNFVLNFLLVKMRFISITQNSNLSTKVGLSIFFTALFSEFCLPVILKYIVNTLLVIFILVITFIPASKNKADEKDIALISRNEEQTQEDNNSTI